MFLYWSLLKLSTNEDVFPVSFSFKSRPITFPLSSYLGIVNPKRLALS
ncbi:hypothetical protein ONA03_00900 [Mycoplasmopsis cynos]|nr:hypothetical protein [Mycoplasmopsis cynos]WAM08931.1 hypothetical protein ONA03_00900 [Mycoplasmopsis cynos]